MLLIGREHLFTVQHTFQVFLGKYIAPLVLVAAQVRRGMQWMQWIRMIRSLKLTCLALAVLRAGRYSRVVRIDYLLFYIEEVVMLEPGELR